MKAAIAAAVVLPVIMLSGCASYRPMVDMKGINQQQYEADLKECQEYAERVSPGKASLVGAGIGAGVGAIVGLAVGIAFNIHDKGSLMGIGAGFGGLNGAAAGGVEAGKSQMDIIRNCMSGRGYTVLR